MTTPYPGTNPSTSGLGGFLSGLLGGATGTLAGTNNLQQSIDQLTNSVNRLSSVIGTLNLGNTAATGAQQQATGGQRFPRMNNPFMGAPQPGIGGGGPGGAGNVASPQPFSRGIAAGSGLFALGSAFAGYGNQQLPVQLGLNAYSTTSMLGMSPGNFSTQNNMMMRQAFGLNNQNLNALASSPMDALAMTRGMQYLGGNPNYKSTAFGRAGFGAAAAFGLSNPLLSGAQSAGLAQQIYSPAFSQRMIALGYGSSPRRLGGGAPQNMGQVMQSILRGWYNKNSVAPATLYGQLSQGGLGLNNLQALGLDPNQTAPVLEAFNKLFQQGVSANRASQLFNQAGINNAQGRAAQATLNKLGITTVSSDIQKIKNNQSVLTGRDANVADGFNAALTASTGTLQKFNLGLSGLMSQLGINGLVGGAGGVASILSGTNHGNSLLGLGGMALMLRGLGVGGGAGGAAGGILGRAGLAGGAGLLGAAAAGGTLYGLSKIHNRNGTSWLQQGPGGPASGWNSWDQAGKNAKNWFMNDPSNWLTNIFGGGFPAPRQGVGGGAAIPTSAQQPSPGGRTMTGNVSGSAVKAVGAAESQLGVPYLWGGETPGVGFDCSGLMQWAYKQAGVNIPRTSGQQWAALKNRSIPTNQVQEGDLVFQAGADGTPNNPGHVGMMISNRALIEAPTTGQDVKIIGYDPRGWTHAARPTGRGGMGSVSGTTNPLNTGNSSLPGLYGNTGRGMGLGNYGSANEVDLINAMANGVMGVGGIGNMSSNGTISTMSSISGTGGGGGPKNLTGIKAIALQMLKARGWGGQWTNFNNLVNRESGWRVNATNPTSGAYGIPQSLPASKMASAGSDWRTNASTQLHWMIDQYMPQRYPGGPNQAWAHELSAGWYGGGGKLGPGMNIVGDRGPEIKIGNSILDNAQSMALLKAVTSQPAQSPWKNISDMTGAGTTTSKSAGSPVHINIGQNAIVVKVDNAGTDASSAGSQIAKQFIKHLSDEGLYTAIGIGDKL